MPADMTGQGMLRARALRRARKSNYNLGLPAFASGTQSQNFLPLPAGMIWRYILVRLLITGKSDAAGFNMLNPNVDTLTSVEGSSDYDVLLASLFTSHQLFLSGTTQLIQQMSLPGYRAGIRATMYKDPVCSFTLPTTVGAVTAGIPNATIAVPAVGAAATQFELEVLLPIGLDWAFPHLDMFRQSSAAMNTGRYELTGAGALPLTAALAGGNFVTSAVSMTLAWVGERPPAALETYAGAAYKLERVTAQQSDSPPIPIARWLALAANNGSGLTGSLTGPIIVDDASAQYATIDTNSVPTSQLMGMSFRQMVEMGTELEAPRVVPIATRLVPPDLYQLPDEMDQAMRSFSIKTNNALATMTMYRLTWLQAPSIAGAVPVASRSALGGGRGPEGMVLVPPSVIASQAGAGNRTVATMRRG